MAAIQQQLINQLTDDQDIAALNFEAALQSDPAKAQQYKADRDSKKFTETLEIKRGNFQKAAIDARTAAVHIQHKLNSIVN